MKLPPNSRSLLRLPSFHNLSPFSKLAGAALLTALPFASVELGAQTAEEPVAQQGATAVGVNLNITPKRLTFGRNDRTATVYIFNQGNAPATFDIAMVDRVMLPSGDIRPAGEAAQDAEIKPYVDRIQSAQGMVVATPRRATLAPGKGQTIRIRVTPPANADAAEYRSHLTVTTVPPRDVGLTAEEAAAARQTDQLSFRITSVFGISIPVIIRPGAAADVRGEIRNARLSYADISPDGVSPPRRTPLLTFDLARQGANSLFGNVEVRSRRDREPIGLARGLGVYTEVDRRLVQVPLQRVPATGEQLEITFVDDDTAPGTVLARASFTAP